MTNIQDDQNVQNQPKKADVDELLKQLEALNQEIASKTVADQTQLEEKKDQPETLEAPPSSPALESSDEPQLPSGDQDSEPKKDLDLDKFINDLEAKIAEKDGGATQVEEPKPEKFQPAEPQLRPAEPQLEAVQPQSEPVKAQPEPVESSVQPEAEPEIQEEQPSLQENFSRQRPSLDLSGVEEKPAPSLTLNNGQLEENKEDKTESPTLTLDSEPTPQSSSEASPEPTPEPAPTSNDEEVNQEDLESQNIFTMLGLENLEETEKEAFLADLEQLIWDNFIEVELPLLLNSEQKAQAEQILADNSKTEDERKEALLVYVEKFIPNLEEVMYKKALSLKKEMFEERLKKMRDQATEENNLSLMADLDQVRELVAADRYKTATELLNKA